MTTTGIDLWGLWGLPWKNRREDYDLIPMATLYLTGPLGARHQLTAIQRLHTQCTEIMCTERCRRVLPFSGNMESLAV